MGVINPDDLLDAMTDSESEAILDWVKQTAQEARDRQAKKDGYHGYSHLYPEASNVESGCKVSWRTYTSPTDALKASAIAVMEGHWLSELGYDFGYQVVGSINEHDGSYTVTCG